MRRLVFVCPGAPGGVRSYITNLAVFLRQAGVDHRILFYEDDEGMSTKAAPGAVQHSTVISYSRYSSMSSVYKTFASLIDKDEVLICSDSLELEAVNYLKLANRVIFILHGDLDHYREILKNNEPILDHIFCVSRGLRDKYSGLFPLLGFSVCHPLVANFTVTRARQEGPLLGVFIGRFETMKGADTFIEVVKGAVKEKIAVRWNVFVTREGGDKELLSEIPAAVEIAYDLSNDKVLASIEKADLLVFPSRSEGFGIVVLEAMKRGVVPVARDLPIGIPDMISDKQTGYLAHNATEMLAIIRELNADRDKLDRMGRQAAYFANEEFDFDQMGRRFLENFDKVVGVPGRRDKIFLSARERVVEKYLPEPLYRLMKRFFKNSSHGRK